MKYVECPEEYIQTNKEVSIFLAGGISNCPNWQQELIDLLSDTNLVIFNPRRNNFDVNNKQTTIKQIEWEHKYLAKADAVSFWFPKETLCPITLFEYGKYLMSPKTVFLGVHPEYSRKLDLEVQTLLERPSINIVYDLEMLAFNIKRKLYI